MRMRVCVLRTSVSPELQFQVQGHVQVLSAEVVVTLPDATVRFFITDQQSDEVELVTGEALVFVTCPEY